MATAHPPSPDPSRDAAALLRRMGFAVILLGLPAGAVATRQSVVLLAPIGFVLLILAALLDGERRPVRDNLAGWRRSAVLPTLALLVGWATLSLLWTPAPSAAGSRWIALAATAGAAAAGYLALPERVRAADLYLAPIGTALAAVSTVGAALVLSGSGRAALESGLIVLVVFAWPSVAWLRSRSRDREAVGLALLLAAAALAGPWPVLPLAVSAGAVAFGAATVAPRRTRTWAGSVLAAAVVAAPLLPFVLEPLTIATAGRSAPWLAALQDWKALVAANPARLLTGHGFGAPSFGGSMSDFGRGRPALLQLWYELGIVGAAATAALLWFGAREAARAAPSIFAGLAAVAASAITLAVFGMPNSRAWWLTLLLAVGFVLVSAARGQARTRRPRAGLLRSSTATGA